MFRVVLSLFLFVLLTGSTVFADTPKVLKLSEVKFGAEAVGFSVLRGVEPQRFEVELRGVTNGGGFNMILARISGGPMETPLERVGAIAGMSGSPIFVGCSEYDECIGKVSVAGNDVFVVGALSYAIGYFIEGGSNAGLTPAEYMLGNHFGGYAVASQFMIRPPNKIIVEGREFHNLILFSGIDGLQTQGALPDKNCDKSVQGQIKPGSMVTVFLAKGSWDIGGSGTVFWKDGDRIYIFGHPFFGTGRVDYPFSHVSVADTLQTPFQAHKIIGCKLETEGAMNFDGAYEMGGTLGQVARTLPYKVELHMGHDLIVFNENVAESPVASAIFNQLPVSWAQEMVGDISSASVSYQTRIKIAAEPEIFLKGLISAKIKKNPFGDVFSLNNVILGKLRGSGFTYNLESIIVHIDFIRGENAWTEKRSFLSQTEASPGETVYVNIVLEEWSSMAVRQISVPVKVPEDFADRIVPGILAEVSVVVQSADKFVDKRIANAPASTTEVIKELNELGNRRVNVLYLQQIMPLTRAEREAAEKNAKLSVQPEWSWTELDQGALRRLPGESSTMVTLDITPELDHLIDFDKTFTVRIDISDRSSVLTDEAAKENKSKGRFNYLKPWKWF